jgi:hypothetical protein
MDEMVHHRCDGAAKAGYTIHPQISRITPIRAQAAGRRPAMQDADTAGYKSSP